MDRRLAWFVIGWVGGVATSALIALAIVGALAWQRDDDASADRASPRIAVATEVTGRLTVRSAPVQRELPRATLTVHEDGCGVIRTDVPAWVDNLTWHIEDADGFEVLGRDASNETRYRYFRPGRYTVVLQAFDGTGYVPISNTVSISC